MPVVRGRPLTPRGRPVSSGRLAVALLPHKSGARIVVANHCRGVLGGLWECGLQGSVVRAAPRADRRAGCELYLTNPRNGNSGFARPILPDGDDTNVAAPETAPRRLICRRVGMVPATGRNARGYNSIPETRGKATRDYSRLTAI